MLHCPRLSSRTRSAGLHVSHPSASSLSGLQIKRSVKGTLPSVIIWKLANFTRRKHLRAWHVYVRCFVAIAWLLAFIYHIIRRQAVHSDTTWWYNEHVCRIIYILHNILIISDWECTLNWKLESFCHSDEKFESFINCEGVPFSFLKSLIWGV